MITRDIKMISIDVTSESLSLLLAKGTHAQYTRRFRAWYNIAILKPHMYHPSLRKAQQSLPCHVPRLSLGFLLRILLMAPCTARALHFRLVSRNARSTADEEGHVPFYYQGNCCSQNEVVPFVDTITGK